MGYFGYPVTAGGSVQRVCLRESEHARGQFVALISFFHANACTVSPTCSTAPYGA